MRWSQTLIPTLKEVPSEAESKSHILMIRAGLIRKLSSGVYSYLPLGLRVLQKVQAIIREEMNNADANELLLPALQPIELWETSGRINALGEDMIHFIDRHKKEMVLGPTHEEVITHLVANEINTYKKLPITLYQIQTKFRDEMRPRFGVLRSREFIMKDAYSFDVDEAGLNISYKKMFDAYCKLFSRCGLEFVPVVADTGVMGGNESHEFMVVSEKGEDLIVTCDQCGYSASLDKATYDVKQYQYVEEALQPLEEVHTPNVKTIEQVADFLSIEKKQLVKTLIYIKDEEPLVVLIRGDYEVNEAKLKNVCQATELSLASEEVIKKLTNAPVGFSGPQGVQATIIADFSVKGLNNFVSGANKQDFHLKNLNVERDFEVSRYVDIRNVIEKDTCSGCQKPLQVSPAIEVGHVFKLGTKYTKSMGAKYLDQNGKEQTMVMGCYGIGVNRIVATAIEQGADDYGIVWPEAISPYSCIVMPLNTKDDAIMQEAERIYSELQGLGIDVLFDDRDERPGVKFKDAELIGIPYQLVVGKSFLNDNEIEFKVRKTNEKTAIKSENIVEHVKKELIK